MLKSIPYLGRNNNDYTEIILSKETKKQAINIDLYSFIIEKLNKDELKHILVIVDNKWITYLQDIMFNYRDKKICLPYYEYKKLKVEDKEAYKEIEKHKNKFQYLIQDKVGNFYVRYDYTYKELEITENTEIVTYNMINNQKIKLMIESITNINKFNIEELYKIYINSCFIEDDEYLTEHNKGYYYIDKFTNKLYNKEMKIRKILNLNTFSIEHKEVRDYRDVRNFKKEEVQSKVGLIETIENYKYRRLRFDSLMFCITYKELLSDNNNFNLELSKLGKTKDIIKYGEHIKLIFKSYWYSEYRAIKQQSWMKIKVNSK